MTWPDQLDLPTARSFFVLFVTPYFVLVSKMMDIFQTGCEMQISDKKLLDQLAAEKFDIAIVHMYDFCPLGIVRVLKIPTHIWMSSGKLIDYMAWYAGVPTPASYVPNALTAMSDHMTYFERMKNFIGLCLLYPLIDLLTIRTQTALFRKYFGEDFPRLDYLARKAPLLFINSDEFIDFPRPILHKVVYIGGIGVTGGKVLKKVSSALCLDHYNRDLLPNWE